jgi:nitroreductase
LKFLDLVKNRQSVRKYTSDPVEKDKLERCLEAARLAPSASNSQPWTYIVVDDPQLREKVARHTFDPVLSFNRFVVEANVLVVIVLEKAKMITRLGAKVKNREFPLIDIGIAAEHFCLQAAEDGMGTCMLGWFNESAIKKFLKIPNSKRIGLIITVGYPPKDYRIRNKTRKPFEQVVRYNSY